jgi:phospholipase/carboxylesterase
MEQQSRRHEKGRPVNNKVPDDQTLTRLFATLDTLATIARMMHPRRLPDLIAMLNDDQAGTEPDGIALDQPLPTGIPHQINLARSLAAQACAMLRAAPDAANPMLHAYRALRHYSAALEALAALSDTVPAVSRYFLEPRYRDDPALLLRLGAPPGPDTGIFHAANETGQRGGCSAFVPAWYDAATPTPVVVALHGGSGHGRLFLWNWLPEARSRGLIIIAPTAIGSTWSLMEPEIDSRNLAKILADARGRWNIDPSRMLLTGMSDGGTFTLLSGLSEDSSFTHLAPAAAAFHPMLLAMTSPGRISGLPIHLTHGAQDWMFPVSGARTAQRMLAAAGAAVTYREIADLSHAYPRDGQPEVLDWFLAPSANRDSPIGKD